uniref:SFRICE_024953 n=1 Tax=Spodoptera frugiperda TaxID=7108 RepID=A0A2H1VTU8_SPOFR
MDGFETPLRTQ